MIIYISHRGNIDGRNPNLENEPSYIDLAIQKGFDTEIDIWVIDGIIYLGHDEPQYEINEQFLIDRKNKLWIHCKNYEAVIYFRSKENDYNYFWHQSDDLTLTSKKYIWVYPGKQPIKKSIAVMPELNNDDLSECIGICSDYVNKYKNQIK